MASSFMIVAGARFRFRDKLLAGFDAAAGVEVIEHFGDARLAAFEPYRGAEAPRQPKPGSSLELLLIVSTK
jgi:hypothetical protein